MKEINVNDLKEMIDKGTDFQLIDVREPHEYEVSNIGGILIPMNTIPNNLDQISKDKKVVIHCRAGGRSANVVQYLETQCGYQNLYNLKGGMLDWARFIDPSITVY